MRCRYCRKKISGGKRMYCNDFCRNAYMLKSKTFEEWTREARECNLDYGTYRALRTMGKSFDELKAQADFAKSPAHSHGYSNRPVAQRF